MSKFIKVLLSRLKEAMQSKDRDEIIFRNRFDKKMQKLFTTLPKPTPICNKNITKYKNKKL
jgi:hypothetical protein